MSRKSKKEVRPKKITAPSPGTVGLNDRWTALGVCLFLAAIVWVVFGQTLRYGFVNCDDNLYVYANANVMGGLTLKGVAGVFTHAECNFYHPLTMLSLMLDYQLYGLHAGGYHLSNLLIHMASVILLFLILRQMTGALWRCAFVAAVFAIHPLRVESVAWVAERKDVLGAFFFMLTLGAYVRYVRKPGSLARYLMVAVFFVLDLLSKPTAVTLPFVLLLLDYWPLHRFAPQPPGGAPVPPIEQPGSFRIPRQLILEKIPLLLLAAAACVVAYFAEGSAVTTVAHISMPLRIGNALISYVVYLRQMVWPTGLTLLYSYPVKSRLLWESVPALLLLAAISGGVLALWRKRPALLVGWLWYLGMMVPMIGLVVITPAAHGDRFTYLPQIGLYVLLTWATADLCHGWRHRRAVLGGGTAIILAALILCARTQVSCWRDNESLWTHTLACTTDNAFAHFSLGTIELQKGKVEDAIAHYQQALQIKPDYAEAHNNLGLALAQKGEMDEAMFHFQQALQIGPDYADAHNNLGNCLLEKGRVDEAMAQFQQALQIEPGLANAHSNLGNCLLQKGSVGEAIAQYQQALQINPDYAQAAYNLAWLWATTPQASLRNGKKAVELAERANQSFGGANPEVLRILAAAYAEAGRFDDAMQTSQKAINLAQMAGKADMVGELNAELKLYQARLPFHQKQP